MDQIALIRKSFCQKYTDIMPQGAGALFFIQMFSTLAFSVLYSTLILYATDGLHLSDKDATSITTSFVAFNYALHLLGGYVGGRFLSYRVLFCIGMTLQIAGCALLSIPEIDMLYWGLATFLTGAGLNVTCINCMMTQLFRPEDKRREAAFLWNYSGMNVGFFAGFAMSGWLQLQHAYHGLFLSAAAGNFFALLLCFTHWEKLKDTHTALLARNTRDQKHARLNGLLLIVLLILVLRFFLENAIASNQLIMLAGMGMMGLIAWFSFKQPSHEQRKKIWAYLILALASVVFWTLYQMAPIGLTLFIDRNVDRHFLGMLVAPQWMQNINTLVIIMGGPVLSTVFTHLRHRGIPFSLPLQFGIALFCIGISLAILPLGIQLANEAGYVSFHWILVSYVLQSVGELFISPIGYAMVGQLAPTELQGVMMGTWMMMTGVAATLSGYFSNVALGTDFSTDPLVTNAGFSHTFGLLGWTSIGVGILLLVLIPAILRLTQEKAIVLKQEPKTELGFS